MRATELILCWNPGTDQVRTVPFPDYKDLSGPYAMTGLACYAELHKMTPEQLKTACFIEAIHLIVRDRCDPAAVHKALLEVDEYRSGCAPDMPGVAAYMETLYMPLFSRVYGGGMKMSRAMPG